MLISVTRRQLVSRPGVTRPRVTRKPNMTVPLTALARDDTGATANEYAFLLALIALAIVGGAESLGLQLDAFFTSAATAVQDATS
jgi:pilus assembly protein Flp/PilA